ncbi:NPCBM/NEW2 domain-containing protein [Streptomyces sp. NPDC001922]|uniref:NPCBM/NEW2 domain-containing protein n=1 Tax=Streptomyces sp. NPDC001922 TaxID=3364624 RepID=UPI0036756753
MGTVLSLLASLGAAGLAGLGAQLAVAPPAAAVEDGLALTPPMGFNNWNSTNCRREFNEEMVKGIADLFVSKGLKKAGYQYVNIDDCWAKSTRDGNGNLVPDPARFPHGIKALADYVHARGLKFGLYTSAGTKTCARNGFPGALGHEQQDARLFASWGVDYLKYDNCNNQGVDARTRYRKMRDALRDTGRPIVFSVCEWGENEPWEWAADVGHLWRTTGDITDKWASMLAITKKNQTLADFAGPGHWNDPDMLEVGNGGMTATEYRSHFSLWSVMAAPLLIGTDLRKASAETFDILTNEDVIAVDQDLLGKQGTVVSSEGGRTVFSKPLANGDRAVVLFNETNEPATVTTSARAIGLPEASSYALRDLWSKKGSTSQGTISASVPSHGVVMYRVARDGGLGTPPAGTSGLSALVPTSVTNGWGPVETDTSNGERAPGDGGPITIQGASYLRGLGVHAPSEVTYHLGGRCSRLTVDVGIDDESSTRGTAVFRVLRDSTKVADSGLLTTDDPAERLTADLSGGSVLRLVVTDGGDGRTSDHADWAEPRITCA